MIEASKLGREQHGKLLYNINHDEWLRYDDNMKLLFRVGVKEGQVHVPVKQFDPEMCFAVVPSLTKEEKEA